MSPWIRALAHRSFFLVFLWCGCAFAGVDDVSPNDIEPWIRHHPQAVVFYQSFDADCIECKGADIPFYALAGRLNGKLSFARVYWKPWNLAPTGIKYAYGHDSPPGVVAYQNGRKLIDHRGKIVNVDELAQRLRIAYNLTLPENLWSRHTNAHFAQAALKWDLGYGSVLRTYAVASNEFLRTWLQSNPQRPILDQVARYAGEPITASMLLDMPDSHAGDPAAVWLIETRRYAMFCSWQKRGANAPCKSVDSTLAGNIIRELMRAKPPASVPGEQKLVYQDAQGHATFLNYAGFVSFYDHGQTLQRPIALNELRGTSQPGVAPDAEAGRLARALARLAASPEEWQKEEAIQRPQQPQPTEPPFARQEDNLPMPRLSFNSTEISVQNEVSAATRKYLYKQDYEGLEALYKKLNDPHERTPSGLWKLEVYFNMIKVFLDGGVDPEYWQAMEKRARDWQQQIPDSVVAHIFEAYIHFKRATVQRGIGQGKTVNPNDLTYMTAWARQGYEALQKVRGQAPGHPEWHRAMVSLQPYLGMRAADVDRVVREGMAVQAAYHPMYFEASYYLLPKWGGSSAMIDRLARNATAASSGTEGRALYARIYWALDNQQYQGSLFKASQASWPDIKNGFMDIIAQYPEPYNLNAFAYFACLAGDYATVDDILQRIGGDLIFEKWGSPGQENYQRCRRHEAISR